MSRPDLVCLSLTTNLRCVGFTLGQFTALIIPPALEVIISLFFIYSYSGPGRWAQVFLAADSILYFIWALLDMLSRILPAVRTSLPLFKALDDLVGAVSFTPILIYSIYLYRLSSYDFIPTLPRRFQLYLEVSLPVLLAMAIATNEVSSFVGAYVAMTFDQPRLVIEFPDNSEFLWFSLSRFSLTIYTILQLLFFLLAFSRLYRAFLDQRRIEATHSDEQHYFNGIPWLASGIIFGVIETVAGFARVSFGVALGRRIIRLIARAVLMFGLLKGLDASEDFENLTEELRGVSRVGRRISHMLGVNPERNVFRRLSRSYSEPSRGDGSSPTKEGPAEQRVTVHYEKGQAPFLQIRFSVLDLPASATIADMVQRRRRSTSGLVPSYVDAGTSTQLHRENDDSGAPSGLEPRRAVSQATPSGDHGANPDWMRPPEFVRVRQDSGGTVSDSLSIVRDLERRFPHLPPRVTGKYRGSILGENYEEDRFPVVGVSRQSSLLHQDGGAQNPSEEGGVALNPSGSIKRKPAPPLLADIAYISDRGKRPNSTWGGLASGSPATPTTPRRAHSFHSPGSTQAGEPSTPRSRRTTARDVIRRASSALSDASIRSAEWLASANSSRSPKMVLTATDIEMYRRGALGPGPARPASDAGEAFSGENRLSRASRRSADDVRTHSRLNVARHSIGM